MEDSKHRIIRFPEMLALMRLVIFLLALFPVVLFAFVLFCRFRILRILPFTKTFYCSGTAFNLTT